MFKMIGGLLIVLACTSLGVEKSKELSRHRRELEELLQIFTFIQVRMECLKLPFDELFANMRSEWLSDLSRELRKHQRNTFEEIWISSIDLHFKDSYLTKSEFEELKQIGKHISRPEAIRLYLTQLENAIQITREEEKEKKKLYQSMGIMLGLFLVLVLI